MLQKITTLLLLCASLMAMSQNTTIYWDTSFSMQERDISKDFEYLSNYFAENNTTSVTLIQFKNGVTAKEVITLAPSNWDALKTKLSSVVYDGATSYQGLTTGITNGTALLFTDGHQTINASNHIINPELILVNSSPTYNLKELQLLALVNNGTLVNMASDPSKLQEYSGTIITQNNTPPEVTVSVLGKNRSTVSKNDGSYRIMAEPSDILVFNSEGWKTVEKVLGTVKNITVFMEDDGISLDEVVIQTKTKTTLEPETKITAYGSINKDAIGYSVQSIGSERISAITTTVSQAVQGKFNSVEYGSGQDLSQAVIRGMNSFLGNNYALVVVDGVALRQSDSGRGSGSGGVQLSDFIDPNLIADITVLKGLAAANRYGSAGKNGVILITTKLAMYTAEANAKKKPENTALLRDNIYAGAIKKTKINFSTPYLKELKKAKTVADAYNVYVNQRAAHATAPAYYIDVADYFSASNQILANQILSNILEDENSSITALKGLLFKAHKQKNYALELEAANKILEMYPQQIQSYLDVAMANKHAGEYQLALNMLNKITTGSINTDLDFSGLTKIIDSELINLITKYRSALDVRAVSPKYLKNKTYDARLTFAWNNADAQFDLQFVNPQKRFFNWEHTMSGDAERLQSEKINGYTKEEFLLIDAEKGKWLVNAIYKGDDSVLDKPTFLTCTIEYNFGKPNQRTEEFLIRLHHKGSEEKITAIFIR